jgi:hypothetical protein
MQSQIMLLIQSLVGIIYGITTAAGNDNIYSRYTIDGLISSGTLVYYSQRNAITSSTTKMCMKHHFTDLQANISLQEVLVE